MVGTLLICSCGKRTSLNESDLDWQPYEVGDSLVFESNRNESFTLVIKKISRYHSVTDPLDLIPDRTEHLSVFAQYSLINPWISSIGDSVFHQDTELLELNAGLDKSSLDLKLKIEDSWFYGNAWFDISDYVKMNTKELFGFNDVLVIEDEIGEYKDRENHVERLYWSKDYGYVRYELKNGYYWELNSFIRNKKDQLIKN